MYVRTVLNIHTTVDLHFLKAVHTPWIRRFVEACDNLTVWRRNTSSFDN
jgi:hypothetical protein